MDDNESLDGLIPTLRRMIGIDVIQHFGEQLHGFFHLRIVPLHCTGKQIGPTFRSDHSKRRALKRARLRPKFLNHPLRGQEYRPPSAYHKP